MTLPSTLKLTGLAVVLGVSLLALAGAKDKPVVSKPGEFASTTLWTAAIGATTKVPEAAKSLIQFLTGPVARPVFTAKGFQPG